MFGQSFFTYCQHCGHKEDARSSISHSVECTPPPHPLDRGVLPHSLSSGVFRTSSDMFYLWRRGKLRDFFYFSIYDLSTKIEQCCHPLPSLHPACTPPRLTLPGIHKNTAALGRNRLSFLVSILLRQLWVRPTVQKNVLFYWISFKREKLAEERGEGKTIPSSVHDATCSRTRNCFCASLCPDVFLNCKWD